MAESAAGGVAGGPMKLDVESLRALQLVIETGGFTEAAAHLGLTQSAVSWKIKRLEERCGTELVKRGPVVEPTPDGRDLLFYVDRIVETHDEAVEHLTRSELAGLVRLGTNEDLRGPLLADVLARFGRRYPNVELSVRVDLSGRVAGWLDDGEIDLAVIQVPASQVRPDDAVVWREQLAWVVGDGHQVDPADVVPIVSFGPGLAYRDDAEASLMTLDVESRVVVESPMLAVVQAAVEAGLGVAALNDGIRTSAMTDWEHGRGDAGLPDICEVIRAGGVADPEVLDALRRAIEQALDGAARPGGSNRAGAERRG